MRLWDRIKSGFNRVKNFIRKGGVEQTWNKTKDAWEKGKKVIGIIQPSIPARPGGFIDKIVKTGDRVVGTGDKVIGIGNKIATQMRPS